MQRRDFLRAAGLCAGLARAAAPRRIAFGGISIECSTYSRIRARTEDFTVWRESALANSRRFAFLKNYPHPFLPTLVAAAVPGGPVERGAYDAFKREFLDRLRSLLPLDGLYLPMHGAMYVEGMDDAEGDWISAARAVVGERCLISASYDLHGNLSRRIVDQIDMFSAYRTAPHIDREETMRRSCDMLVGCLDKGIRPTLVWAPIPVLMPGERSSTLWEPAKRLWAQLPAINRRPGVLDASLLVGYVWADEPRATASAVLTGTAPGTLKEAAVSVARQYWDARREFRFGMQTGTLADCIARAQRSTTHPVILADSGDNPTGGGTGDRAEVLQELLRVKFPGALVAGIADRPATEACYRQRPGDTLALHIGGSLDPAGSRPVEAKARVVFLLAADDPAERQAVVEVEGIKVVLTARRRPFHNIQDFTILGLDPKAVKLVVVKSGYLSPELEPIANPNLMALTDGAINQDIEHLSNKRRIPSYPFVQDLKYRPSTVVSARSK